jgi:signal transduction histidine kinase
MFRSQARAPLLLFGLVALYIVLQSAWCKERDVLTLQEQLLKEGVAPLIHLRSAESTRWMLIGEGGVFVALLLVALWLTFRTVRHELSLARQQRDFLLATSHELRTPIAGLKLHLATLARPEPGVEQREHLLALCRTETDRLRSLTEKILLATRLDEAHVPLSVQSMDVVEEARSICSGAQASYAAAHHIVLESPKRSMLKTDRDAFRSVLGNLLENASKYAPAGTNIKVQLFAMDGHLELLVSDEGSGVRSEDRSRIFEKFARGGSEEVRETKGTGLGLYIVSRLMHAMGGRIEHRPRQPRGSIFVATFPLH